MPPQSQHPKAYLFWETAGIWSLLAWQALCEAGLAVEPLSAAQIAAGALPRTGLLMVPGGWPSLKKKALGPEGADAVRRFVRGGGFYLGLCGGAGLSLDVADGLGLLPLGRYSGKRRLTAVSGPVLVEPTPEAASMPWWRGLSSPARFQVWWPGQFAAPENGAVRQLAAYAGAAPGLCTSDLEADQVEPGQWAGLEKAYGSMLNPKRLTGLPAVVQAEYGQGRVFLSYLHFDTPGDANGRLVLQNLWQEALGNDGLSGPVPEPSESNPGQPGILAGLEELWGLGEKLELWRPRKSPSIFPLWRRGSRGLEFFSLLKLSRAAVQNGAHGDDLEKMLKPLLDQGPRVLAAQATILNGQTPSPADAKPHADWFPRPRRTGGDLAQALAGLEKLLFNEFLSCPAH